MSISQLRPAAVAASAFALVACAGFVAGRAGADVPTHVLSYTNYKGSYNHTLVAATDAAKWLDLAMTNARDAGETGSAGIKVVVYTNPNRVSLKEFGYSDDESMYAHDCSNARLTVVNRKDPTYLTDPSSGAAQQRWAKQVASIESRAGHVDYVFDDTADSVGRLSGKPCNFNQDQWTQANVALISAQRFQVIYNGLSDIGGSSGSAPHISAAIGLNAAPNAVGGMFEGCYVRAFLSRGENPLATGAIWQVTENTQIAMAQAHKMFVCHSRADGELRSEQAIDFREYTYASFMLTYDPATSVLSEPYYTSDSGFNVNPEIQLVPTSPLVPEPSDVSSLRTKTGAYGREFAQCYILGKPVGPCAAVVNPDAGAHDFPFPGKYRHTLVLRGGGVMDGGSIGADGPPPPSSVGAASGVIALQ